MRGEVEIWKGETLLLKEPNMLVDGAGVLLADIMTVSPSLSSVVDLATSSILDASNYTIQAISFGTGKTAYNQNAHKLNAFTQEFLTATEYDNFGDRAIPAVVAAVSSTQTLQPGTAFSYYPLAGLPDHPNPEASALEMNIGMEASIGGIAVSSVFPANGQLVNFMPSAIMSSLVENTVFSSTVSGYVLGSIMGCFPEGSSAPYGLANDTRRFFNYVISDTDITPSALIQQTNRADILGSYFNEVSSMDVSGFVNMIMSSVPNPGYAMSSPASGLTISANDSFLTNGTVEYSVSLSLGDMGHANIYGGIYHLGLWTIDMNKSLLNGNTPPFSFSILNNPRKYRLFSRKGLSKNMCHIDSTSFDGDENYQDLTIKWRLHFL